LSSRRWVAPASSAGLLEPVDLYDDPLDAGGHSAAHRLADRPGDRDMVVLDHR
jgi:hypothetical protein